MSGCNGKEFIEMFCIIIQDEECQTWDLIEIDRKFT